MNRNNNILIPCIIPSLQLQYMFPLLPWEAEMPKTLYQLFLVYSEEAAASRAAANKQNKSPWFICTVVFLQVFRFSVGVPPNIFNSSISSDDALFLEARCSRILLPPYRNERGSNGPDDDSKRWFWGHCVDTACRELPQPFASFVAFFLLSPVRHPLS